MRILVTGAAGFIGFHFCRELLKQNDVVGIDNMNNYYDVNLKIKRLTILKNEKRFQFYETNIQDINNLRLGHFDLVVHLAAQPGVRLDRSKNKKYIDSNISATIDLLDYCVDNEVNKVMFASSSSVYSGNNLGPFSEDCLLSLPSSLYAATKIFNEHTMKIYHQKNNIDVVGLRFFTVYGPYGRPDMAYFSFLENILSDTPISLFNGGESARDMTFIDDIIYGMCKAKDYLLRQNNIFELFNLGNEKPIKTKQMLSSIEKILSKKAVIQENINLSEPSITCACLKKSKKDLGYYPKVSFNEGIEIFSKWFLGERNKL
tara:strand:+ start:60 stop:1010 length:951 start_codon:yes stop_codon:yes gene_type:complete